MNIQHYKTEFLHNPAGELGRIDVVLETPRCWGGNNKVTGVQKESVAGRGELFCKETSSRASACDGWSYRLLSALERAASGSDGTARQLVLCFPAHQAMGWHSSRKKEACLILNKTPDELLAAQFSRVLIFLRESLVADWLGNVGGNTDRITNFLHDTTCVGPYGGLLRILSCHFPHSRGLEFFLKPLCECCGIALLCGFREPGRGSINEPKEIFPF